MRNGETWELPPMRLRKFKFNRTINILGAAK